ncbi:MAG: glycosyltransferase [Pseudomonadota bacterium]
MGKSNGNQIIGCMRFSYISKGGFAHSHDPQEEQERLIYAADRMERRFKLFEHFALKSLKQQTDQDFKCIFLITQTFPAEYRQRLEDLIGDWSPGIIIAKPFMPQFRAIRACYEEVQDDELRWITSFRLDDDDMLDKRFVERVRRLALPLARVRGDGNPLIISFNKGVYLEIGEDENRIFDACERTPLSVGAAMITHTGKRENIYSRNHRKLAAFFPAYSELDEPSWLRTVHQDNDSIPEFTGILDKREPSEVDQWLADGFDVSREWLMEFGR